MRFTLKALFAFTAAIALEIFLLMQMLRAAPTGSWGHFALATIWFAYGTVLGGMIGKATNSEEQESNRGAIGILLGAVAQFVLLLCCIAIARNI